MLGLAVEGEDSWRKNLLERIENRVEQIGALRVLGFLRSVDDALPGLIDSRPVLVKGLFKKGVAGVRRARAAEREALIQFALVHEHILLNIALRILEDEEHISTRHFLVTLLGSFSPSATPIFVSKARHGPWVCGA